MKTQNETNTTIQYIQNKHEYMKTKKTNKTTTRS